jgi:metal-responsive CopG/Arc/MetJ family transcriptional regulator
MERINIQFEETMLKKIKLVAAVENKSIAAVLRDAAHAYLSTKTDLKEKIDDILRVSDSAFDTAMEQSFTDFDSTYTTLAQ